MKKLSLVFGSIAGIIPASMFFIMHNEDGFDAAQMDNGQIIGYLTMVIAFSTIFFAVKRLRDLEPNRNIAFKRAFLLGLYITLVASVIYVVAWEIYSATMMGDFADQYVQHMRDDLANKGLNEVEIDAELAPNLEMMELYKNNVAFRVGVTFMEIFPVGLIISLLSALLFGVILKRADHQ